MNGQSVCEEADKQRKLLDQAETLLRGLERISADSVWAHRSSGCRGSLLRQLDRLEANQAASPEDLASLEWLVQTGYKMLIRAAREIGCENHPPA
jgi:hypothetical protein